MMRAEATKKNEVATINCKTKGNIEQNIVGCPRLFENLILK